MARVRRGGGGARTAARGLPGPRFYHGPSPCWWAHAPLPTAARGLSGSDGRLPRRPKHCPALPALLFLRSSPLLDGDGNPAACPIAGGAPVALNPPRSSAWTDVASRGQLRRGRRLELAENVNGDSLPPRRQLIPPSHVRNNTPISI
jgi:hypothetical protein